MKCTQVKQVKERSGPSREYARLFCNIKPIDIILATLTVVLGIAALSWYNAINDNVLRLLLWPHAKIVGAFYHITMYYQPDLGYVAEKIPFVIGQACMGINFIVMLFCLMTCVFICRFRGFHKIIFFTISLTTSVIVGVLVSCIRIIGSIPFLSFSQFTTIHTGVGITFYLVALICSYILLDNMTRGAYEKHQ